MEYVDNFEGDTFTDLLDGLAQAYAIFLYPTDREDNVFARMDFQSEIFSRLVAYFSTCDFPYPNYFEGFPENA